MSAIVDIPAAEVRILVEDQDLRSVLEEVNDSVRNGALIHVAVPLASSLINLAQVPRVIVIEEEAGDAIPRDSEVWTKAKVRQWRDVTRPL